MTIDPTTLTPSSVANLLRLVRSDGITPVAFFENAYDAVVSEQLLDDVGGEETLTFSLPFGDPKIGLMQNEMCVHVTRVTSDPQVPQQVTAIDAVYVIRTPVAGYDDSGTKIVTVYCEARWYDLATEEVITVPTAVNTALDAMTAILAATSWTVGAVTIPAAVAGASWASVDLITPLAALRSLPAVFGGELFFDTVNKQVSLIPRRGDQNRHVMFVHGANMQHDTRTVDTTQLVTRLHPIGASDIDITSVNGGVPYIEDYSYFDTRGMPRQVRAQAITNDMINDPAALLVWAQNQMVTLAQPQYRWDVGVAVFKGQAIPRLGDMVRVNDSTLGLDTNARISRREFNVIQPQLTVLTVDTAAYTLATPGSGGTGLPSGSSGTDSTIPNPPTNLTITFTSGFDPNGNWDSYGIATWQAPTANSDGSPIADFDHYDLQLMPQGIGTWQQMGSTTDLSAGIGYLTAQTTIQVRVRAVDHTGNRSAWDTVSTPVPLPTPFYEPPSAPQLDVDRLPLTIEVTWDGVDDKGHPYPPDVDNMEIHVSTVAGFTPSAATVWALSAVSLGGFTYPLTGLDPGTTYYIAMEVVGRLDTHSKPSVTVAGTVQPVGPTHLAYNGDQDNMVPDGSFETEGGRARILNDPSWMPCWQFVTAATAPGGHGSAAINNGAYALIGAGGNNAGSVRRLNFVTVGVQPFQKVWAKLRYWNTATGGTVTFGITAFDSAGAVVDSTSTTLAPNGGYALSSFTYAIPANASSFAYWVQMDAATSAGTLFLDSVELRSIIQTAIIDQLAVTDAQIGSVSAGKITVGVLLADITISARIKTADSGPRVELNSGGIGAWNSSGVQTVAIRNDGSASFTGTITGSTIIGSLFETATSGYRVTIDGDTAGGRAIKFYSGLGSETSPAGIGAAAAGGILLTTANGAADQLWLGAGIFRLTAGGGQLQMQSGVLTLSGYGTTDLTGAGTLYLPSSAHLGTGSLVMGTLTGYQYTTCGQSYQATDANGYADIAHGLFSAPAVVIGTCQFPIGGVANIPVSVMTDTYGSSTFRARFFDQNGTPYAGKFVTLNWLANG